MKNDDEKDLEPQPPQKRVCQEREMSSFFIPKPDFAKMRKTILRLIRSGEKRQLDELISRINLPQNVLCQFFHKECGTFFYAGLSNNSNLDMLIFLLDRAVANKDIKQIFIERLKQSNFFILQIFTDVQKENEQHGEDTPVNQQARIEKIKILCQIDMGVIREFRQVYAKDMTAELQREFDLVLQGKPRQLFPVNI